jgi:hypothetical protein
MHHGVHGWRLRGGRGRSGSRGEEEGGRGNTHVNGQGHGSAVGVRWLRRRPRHGDCPSLDHGR